MTIITILASCIVLALVGGLALLERRFRNLEQLLERQHRLIEGLSTMTATIPKPVTNRIERRTTEGSGPGSNGANGANGTNAHRRDATATRLEPSPRGSTRLAEPSPRSSKRLEPSPRSSYQLREASARDQLPEPVAAPAGSAWEPSHRITFQPEHGSGESWLVLVVATPGGGRKACTKSEWAAGVPPAWSCGPDGAWTHHGRSTPGGVKGRITVDVAAPA